MDSTPYGDGDGDQGFAGLHMNTQQMVHLRVVVLHTA